MIDTELAASQTLRAVRGERSQVAFARRLGYRANPITDWENGRRFPTAAEAFRVCERSGIDVVAAFARFHPSLPLKKGELAPWLDALRGSRSTSALAETMGCSRFAVARWLKGATQPRLPEFFRLVQVITGRLAELVAELVPIDRVPALSDGYRAARAAKDVAIEEPWSEAILRIIEVSGGRATQQHIAAQLGIETATVHRILARLRAAGIVERRRGYRVVGELNVDTSARPDAERRLREHWSAVLAARAGSLREHETFGYNVMSLSSRDLGEVREILRRAYREIRSLVAASEPRDAVAFTAMGLLELTTSGGLDKATLDEAVTPQQHSTSGSNLTRVGGGHRRAGRSGDGRRPSGPVPPVPGEPTEA